MSSITSILRDEAAALAEATRNRAAKVDLIDVALWVLWAGWILAALLLWAPTSWGQGLPLDNGPRSISGWVGVDAENGGAAGVRVEIRSVRQGLVTSALTDKSGRFEVSGLPAGSYVVNVEHAGYEREEQQVDTHSSLFNNLMFRLRRGASSVAGRVGNLVSVRELRIPSKARNALEKGIELLTRKHDPAGSMNYFKLAAATYPSYYEAYYNIGLAEMRLGQNSQAEEAFQRAIDLSGGNYAEPQFALSVLMGQRGQYAEAGAISRRGLLLEPASPRGHLSLAVALFGLNQLNECEKNAKEALRLAPEIPLAHILLANVYVRRGQPAAVVEHLNGYLKLQPNGPLSERARQTRDAAQRQLAAGKSNPATGEQAKSDQTIQVAP